METTHNILFFQLHTLLNFGGVLYALYKLYGYFSPEKRFSRDVLNYVKLMVLCLLLVLLHQLATLSKPYYEPSIEAWTIKVLATAFFIKSIRYTRIAERNRLTDPV